MGLFTIGHSTNTRERFVELLRMHAIDCVLDVRSVPYSRYVSQFNADGLGPYLSEQGIGYFAAGKPFGARRDDPTLYPNGYLDFELVRQTSLFKRGVEHAMARLDRGENIALMCTEKQPIDCHRAIMVARGFELAGVEVDHILQDGSLLSQRALNEQLLDLYFPDHAQMSLFGDGDEALLEEAYAKRNEKIGYRLSEHGGGRNEA